jgi:hypothetical protein
MFHVVDPLLFLIYINDLPEKLHSSAKLFADDCLLHREINTTSDTNKLQEDLDMLQKWESKWKMAFNADKCFVIRAGTKRKTMPDPPLLNRDLSILPAKGLGT